MTTQNVDTQAAVAPIRGRRLSRCMALQAVYAWSVSGQSMQEIEYDMLFFPKLFQFTETLASEKTSNALTCTNPDWMNVPFFKELIHGVVREQSSLSAWIQPLLDIPIEKLTKVEYSAIMIGAYELTHCPKTPRRVVINEAIELVKQFGATDGYKLVNGVLDKLNQSSEAALA